MLLEGDRTAGIVTPARPGLATASFFTYCNASCSGRPSTVAGIGMRSIVGMISNVRKTELRVSWESEEKRRTA